MPRIQRYLLRRDASVVVRYQPRDRWDGIIYDTDDDTNLIFVSSESVSERQLTALFIRRFGVDYVANCRNVRFVRKRGPKGAAYDSNETLVRPSLDLYV